MKQKQISLLMFRIMTFIMSVFKIFRNIEKEIQFTGIKTGDVVLDFGCGLGLNTIPAAKIVGTNGKIYALDIHKKAIETVKRKINKNKLENVETILSGSDTGLANNSIDIVFLLNTFPMIQNKEDVLKEINRVLKGGGILYYKSGMGSQLMTKNKMTDNELLGILKNKYQMTMLQKKNNHYLLKK